MNPQEFTYNIESYNSLVFSLWTKTVLNMMKDNVEFSLCQFFLPDEVILNWKIGCLYVESTLKFISFVHNKIYWEMYCISA